MEDDSPYDDWGSNQEQNQDIGLGGAIEKKTWGALLKMALNFHLSKGVPFLGATSLPSYLGPLAHPLKGLKY